ncbi:MAG: hypothetical protein M5R37_14730 [Melioribacteraceae bacterium]|nr:hypothetical protein [Melioribacteraceae bacterium]
MKISIVRIIVALVLFTTSIFAQVPKDIESIPVMPGAKYSENYTQIVINGGFEALHFELFGLNFIETKKKGFITDASYEQVVAYYKKVLGAKESDYIPDVKDFAKMKNNSTAFIQSEDSGYNVYFTWIYKKSQNEVYKFYVTTNKEMNYKDEKGNSVFHFIQNRYGKNIPLEKQSHGKLYAPLYPNAIYLPEESLEMGRASQQVFVTNDKIEDILKFYEKELNQKHIKDESGDVGFLNYHNDYPDDLIAIRRLETGEIKITYSISTR